MFDETPRNCVFRPPGASPRGTRERSGSDGQMLQDFRCYATPYFSTVSSVHNQSVSQSTIQSIKTQIKPKSNQSINQINQIKSKQPVNQSINQFSQTTNQLINQSMNQGTLRNPEGPPGTRNPEEPSKNPEEPSRIPGIFQHKSSNAIAQNKWGPWGKA